MSRWRNKFVQLLKINSYETTAISFVAHLKYKIKHFILNTIVFQI